MAGPTIRRVFTSRRIEVDELVGGEIRIRHDTEQTLFAVAGQNVDVIFDGLSLTDRLNSSSAYRVLLALELSRQRPECDVIVSGSRQTAHVMAQALEELGVPRQRLRIEDQGDSTADSAKLAKVLKGCK